MICKSHLIICKLVREYPIKHSNLNLIWWTVYWRLSEVGIELGLNDWRSEIASSHRRPSVYLNWGIYCIYCKIYFKFSKIFYLSITHLNSVKQCISHTFKTNKDSKLTLSWYNFNQILLFTLFKNHLVDTANKKS